MLKTMTGSDAELLPEHYATVSDRDVLIRLQNNIKLRKIQNNDAEGASAIVHRDKAYDWGKRLCEKLRELRTTPTTGAARDLVDRNQYVEEVLRP